MRARSVRYASPCVVVWTAYLLAFWPGVLSKDDVFEWQRLRNGVLGNDVPVAHELLVRLIILVGGSPALLAAVQIAALSLTLGFICTELERWRVGPIARWLTVALFALSWVNGLMVIWVGRDTAFAIATLALAGILLRLVRTDGRWLRPLSHAAATSGVLLLVSLLRHNGPLVSAGSALALLGIRDIRWRIMVTALVAGLGWLLLTGGARVALGARPTSPRIRVQYLLHHIAAYVSDGGVFDGEPRDTIEALAPLQTWKERYDCYTVDRIIWAPEFNAAALEGREEQVVAAWRTAAWNRPMALLRHQLCAGSLVWRITEVRPPIDRCFTVPLRYVDPAASKLPRLASGLRSLRSWTTGRDQIWWAWRPALYLYLAIAATAAAAWRTKQPRLWIVLVPALVNSATWLAFGMAQHFRYQYPVYLVALLTPALLRLRRDT